MTIFEWVVDNIPDEKLDEAALWIARLDSEEVTKQDQVDFAIWLQSDPIHAKAYEELTPVWAKLSTLSELNVLLEHEDIVPISHARTMTIESTVGNRGSAPSWSIKATLCFLILGFLALVFLEPKPDVYFTVKGEQKYVVLSDESTIFLNTDSLIEVHMTDELRQLTLLKGEAIFDISNDLRPFNVKTSFGSINSGPTSFYVADLPSMKKIQVYSGQIEVIPPVAKAILSEYDYKANHVIEGKGFELEAGQAYPEQIGEVSNTKPTWLNGMLVWKQVPLPEAVEEFERYIEGSFLIASNNLPNIYLNGSVAIGDTKTFLDMLSRLDVQAKEFRPGRYILRKKNLKSNGG
ncbi:FecR family protein [Paraglaciecola sp. 2405UD69-4]|uniref:FecR family protein n=1 Tax=Paraglaciecola sp. 2405UD69-4 TaxID=3391836 RepID=UPI0039C988BD